ncbi:MAG: GNAT family N-acetyltransferase [Steroidobacteraceae bacterium]
MRIELERPTPLREQEFLEAVRHSRKLHKGLVAPPVTAGRYRAYLNGLRADTREGFFVVVKRTDTLAGVITISEIVRGSFQSAYLGYYALEPHAGSGYLREGTTRVIAQAFGKLKLHRLEANIQPGNRRSLALAKGLGFKREGYSPRYLKVCGRWRDHERWALLAE